MKTIILLVALALVGCGRRESNQALSTPDSSAYWKASFDSVQAMRVEDHNRVDAAYEFVFDKSEHYMDTINLRDSRIARLEHELQIAAAELTILRDRPTQKAK